LGIREGRSNDGGEGREVSRPLKVESKEKSRIGEGKTHPLKTRVGHPRSNDGGEGREVSRPLKVESEEKKGSEKARPTLWNRGWGTQRHGGKVWRLWLGRMDEFAIELTSEILRFAQYYKAFF